MKYFAYRHFSDKKSLREDFDCEREDELLMLLGKKLYSSTAQQAHTQFHMLQFLCG